MIKGHGIDIQLISEIRKVYEKRPAFARKVLTEKEYQRFEGLSDKRKMEYLAGRWAVKEAYVKALGTGIGAVGFQDIEVLTDEKGKPVITQAPLSLQTWISISHTGDFVQASVILEDVDESKHP